MEERNVKIVRDSRKSLKEIKFDNSKKTMWRGLMKMHASEIS